MTTIEDVLAKHRYRQVGNPSCTCGWQWTTRSFMAVNGEAHHREAHERHVAEALRIRGIDAPR